MHLTIEKLIYGGEGLARLPADGDQEGTRGKAVFVPLVLAGEKIEATLTEQKPGFARAKADRILQASAQRVSPACRYFGACGGCHYQHAGYEHQIEIKKEILRENLRRIAKVELQPEIEVHPSPPLNYRNRSRLQLKTKPQFAAGYFRLGSHEIEAIEECPISSPLINRAIQALWKAGRGGKVPDGVREIEFFANAQDEQMLVEVSCAPDMKRAAAREFVEELHSSTPEIVGVVAFRAQKSLDRSRAPAGDQQPFVADGETHLTYQSRTAAYRVSASTFFQTNRFLIDELVKIVTAGASGESALDLYAGVGLFSTALAGDIRHIVSVESSQTAAADLAYNLSSKGEAIQASTEEYLNSEVSSGRTRKGKALPHISHTPDLTVVDPPRSGLGERVARALANLQAARLTYVSCDPATLARDLVPLLGAGYHVREAHLVDMFPQTYHIETVLKLER